MGARMNVPSVVEEENVNDEILEDAEVNLENVEEFNFIIIGGGAAGLSSAMYATRYSIKTLVADAISGGALATSPMVENVPGVLPAPGREIMDNLENQAKESGASILPENIKSIIKVDDYFLIITDSGKTVKSKKVLLATGNTYNKLGVKGEKEFLGKGVSYCATCDGNFYKNKTVAVIGGGNTALTEALHLANICKKVVIVHRGKEFSAEEPLVEKIKNNPNIEVVFNSEVGEIVGEEEYGVTGLNLKSGSNVYVEGVFIAVGSTPNTDLIKNLDVEKDEDGYIVVNERQETNIDGLFAAGDNTDKNKNVKQAVTSAAEGVIAAVSVHEDLLNSGVKLKKRASDELEVDNKVVGYKEITSLENFNKFINSGKKVSVTFSASWCGPCRLLKSQLKESTKEGLGIVMDDEGNLCKKFTGKDLKSFPTTFIFENGKIIETVSGADYEGIISNI